MFFSRSLLPRLLMMIISYTLIMSSPGAIGAELPQVQKEYTFAVIPQAPPEVMHRNWLPFIERFSSDTGLLLRLKLYEKIADFEDDLKQGRVDFAYMTPVQAVMAWKAQKYLPLVRNKNLIAGSIFVRKDSTISKLSDLKGKAIAFIGPKNVCSIILTHDMDALQMSRRYVGSSSNVYKQVAIGDVAAGGTLDTAFERSTPEVKQMLRPIYTTELLSPHPITVHPSVDARVRQSIIEVMLKYSGDKDTLAMLEKIQMQNPVVADYQRDYQPLEKLGLESFATEY
jgi:phosphonate transport system substrate-binding protein